MVLEGPERANGGTLPVMPGTRLSLAHVKSAARAVGLGLVALGASQLSRALWLLPRALRECAERAPVVYDSNPCVLFFFDIAWAGEAAAALVVLGGALMTTRRRWVGWGLIAILAMWFLSPFIPSSPFRYRPFGYPFHGLKQHGLLMLIASILLLSDRFRRAPILLREWEAFAQWVSPKWILRAAGAAALLFAVYGLRRMPRMVDGNDDRWPPHLWLELSQLHTLGAPFGVSLLLLGVALIVARRQALAVALLVVSVLVVVHALVPSFPFLPLDPTAVSSNLSSRPLFSAVHIGIGLLLALGGFHLLRSKPGPWFASDDPRVEVA
jgi:hypothetical protein